MKKDISHFAIKAICPRYDSEFSSRIPKDVECTLLFVIGHSKKANNLIKRDEFLQLIYEASDSAEFIVRWDHDKKDILFADNLLIRSFGKLQLYSSIWKDINLYDIVDNRKYYELKPLTALPPKICYRINEPKIANFDTRLYETVILGKYLSDIPLESTGIESIMVPEPN